jgi:hypothetical protein
MSATSLKRFCTCTPTITLQFNDFVSCISSNEIYVTVVPNVRYVSNLVRPHLTYLQRGGRHAGLRRSHLHVDGVEGVWSALDEEASVRNLGSAAK